MKIVKDGDCTKFVNHVEQVAFSGDYAKDSQQNVKYVTERCVFELRPEGLTLTEIAPGIDLKKHILDKIEFEPAIASDLQYMDLDIFNDDPMHLWK